MCTGRFVQWIPHTMLFVRTLFGMLASFAYLMFLFLARPYKRDDVSTIALGGEYLLHLHFS